MSQVATLLKTEKFEDLAKNAFRIAINRVQQVAIQKLGSKIATPAEQLALIAQRRTTKGSRSRSSLNCIWTRFFNLWFAST